MRVVTPPPSSVEIEHLLSVAVERARETVDRGASPELAAAQIRGYVQRHWRLLEPLGVECARDLASLRVTVVEGRVTLDLRDVRGWSDGH